MRKGWFDSKLRETVVVHKCDGITISGVLEATTRDGVILRAASVLGDKDTPLGGEVFIPREEVSFAQLPG